MKEHPLLCTDSVVRNILAGRQTQDRRPIKFPSCWAGNITQDDLEKSGFWICNGTHWQYGDDKVSCPYGVPDDVLWVRECWRPSILCTDLSLCFIYRSDFKRNPMQGLPWHASIHMPRKACRILLEVLRVWVERVQDISEEDATAECAADYEDKCWPYDGQRGAFARLWDSIYAKAGFGWNTNPWVWCCEFKAKE